VVVAFFAFPFEVPSSGLSILFIIGMLEVMTNRVLRSDDEPEKKFTFSRSWTGPLTGTALALTVLFWAYSSTYMWHVLRAEVYFKESRVMKDLNQWDVARSLLDDSIRYYPQNEAYYYDRSIFAIRENDIPGALNDLQKTANLVPNYGMGHKQMGLLAAQMGDYRRAAKEFQIAFRIYDHSEGDYVPLIINAYLGYGNSVSAVAFADKVALVANPDVQLAVSQAYIAAKTFDKAEAALKRALELKPNFPEARVFMGLTFEETGRHQEALDQFELAEKAGVQRQQGNVLKVGRAKALISLGRMAEAKQVVSSAVATDPASRAMFANDPVLRSKPELQPLLAQ
jgi:tetratricopeptide (TPR) repeat protein